MRFSKVIPIFALLKETTLLTINPRPPAEYKQARKKMKRVILSNFIGTAEEFEKIYVSKFKFYLGYEPEFDSVACAVYVKDEDKDFAVRALKEDEEGNSYGVVLVEDVKRIERNGLKLEIRDNFYDYEILDTEKDELVGFHFSKDQYTLEEALEEYFEDYVD